MNNNYKRTISNPSDWFVRLVSEAVAARRAQSRRGYFQKWEKVVVQSNSA
jgi:hypothetical protein